MCANDPPDHKNKLQAPCCSNFQKRNDQLAWDVAISAAIQLHCLAMTLLSNWHCPLQWQCTRSCVTYMMQGYQWKEDELLFTLYVTCKYLNQLTWKQWAFENGLPLFWYTLYIQIWILPTEIPKGIYAVPCRMFRWKPEGRYQHIASYSDNTLLVLSGILITPFWLSTGDMLLCRSIDRLNMWLSFLRDGLTRQCNKGIKMHVPLMDYSYWVIAYRLIGVPTKNVKFQHKR